MNDTSQTITIGGDLPRSALATLFEAALADGVALDWGDTASLGDTPEEFAEAIPGDGPLRLVSDHASGSGFPQLEEACRSLDLTYVVYCEAHEGSAASHTWWQRGMKQPATGDALDEHTPAVALAVVRNALSSEDLPGSIASLHECLNTWTPIEVPVLTLVEQTEGAAA